MPVIFQSHGGNNKPAVAPHPGGLVAAAPAGADIAVDEQADFGYFFPPQAAADKYLPEAAATIAELDALGNEMIDQNAVISPEPAPTNSTIPRFLPIGVSSSTTNLLPAPTVKAPSPTFVSRIRRSRQRWSKAV